MVTFDIKDTHLQGGDKQHSALREVCEGWGIF